MWPFSSSNTAVVNGKREQRARLLADVPKEASAEQSVFLKSTATKIVSMIEKGEWTASQVLEAFISRAVVAHAETNCLTEVMIEQARERAKELDREFASTKKLRGPLHGVPISIKDQYNIIGVDSSVGFSQWANKPAETNADIINQLLAAGAILYVKTNIPQTMFAFECSNPVWGRTTNPYNRNYTCGGSSGGEAALIAMDGSPLGVGSDIGGSLRIPAFYCGIYSLKPASGRLSYAGAKGTTPGFEGIKSVGGPMARSIEDLRLFARTTFGVQGINYDIAPVPFRDVKLPSKLRFGYYTSDGYVKASPACKRAVLETVEALRKQGHDCIEFELPDAGKTFNVFTGLVSADGFKTMLSHLGPDRKENALFISTLGPKIPWFIRSMVTWLLESVMHDKLFADTMRSTKEKPVHDYMDLVKQRNEYTRAFYENVWNKFGFDGIIAPTQAIPQLPHGGCDNFSALAIGTIYYNVIDMAAGCIPVTRVDASKDQVTDEWIKEPGHGSPLMEAGIYHARQPLYDPVSCAGMPVGIQIIGKRWEEEKVLAMMDVVDEALGKDRGFGPGSWDVYMQRKGSMV